MVTTPKFSFVGGALCLDFINTVGTRKKGELIREKLRSPDDLKRWAAGAGIACGMPRTLARAIALREALFRICTSTLDGRAPAENDLAVLNRELGRAQLRYTGGAFRVSEEASLLGVIARSAVDLLTSDELARLRRCGGVDCGWLFLDTSRNGSRQWCDMRVCGNRAKARAFRERARKT
ncbi:MAG: CGNR zinc finger domain-containing protein [Acidobacteriia bacterium]|nr:CGNR zinc finger domain-containing protein [Terriglobia bacterium]